MSPHGCHALGTRSCAGRAANFYLFVRFLLCWIIISCVLCRVRRLPKMEGSIISSTRILIAAAFGPVLLAGEMLPLGGRVELH
ncbi:MAG: hypothetical protein ACPGTI_00755 [bacterium]